MIDPVEIMNRFTEYDPSKGEEPLPLPIPGHWFRKICALADRIARAENELRRWRTGEIAGIEFVPVMIEHIEAQRDAAMAQGALMRDKITQLNAEIDRLREAGKKLLTASEMRREFEINSSEDFNEMYPDPDGWAHGDVDENWLIAMDAMRTALTPPEVK